MMLRFSKCLLTIAALSCMAMPAFASEPGQQVQPPACKQPNYPRKPLARGETGVSKLGFLVRPDGTVARSIVLSSSGSARLDLAASLALSSCLYPRPAGSDIAGEVWRENSYIWFLVDDSDMLEAKQAAAFAAKNGSSSAFYQLSLLLSTKARNSTEHEQALLMLQSAAELGHAHAEYELGVRFERGNGVQADLDEALRWYRKSADQGDPFAIQRLALGRLWY